MRPLQPPLPHPTSKASWRHYFDPNFEMPSENLQQHCFNSFYSWWPPVPPASHPPHPASVPASVPAATASPQVLLDPAATAAAAAAAAAQAAAAEAARRDEEQRAAAAQAAAAAEAAQRGEEHPEQVDQQQNMEGIVEEVPDEEADAETAREDGESRRQAPTPHPKRLKMGPAASDSESQMSQLSPSEAEWHTAGGGGRRARKHSKSPEDKAKTEQLARERQATIDERLEREVAARVQQKKETASSASKTT